MPQPPTTAPLSTTREKEGGESGKRRIPTLTLLYSPQRGVVGEAPRRIGRGGIQLGRDPTYEDIHLGHDPTLSRLHATVRGRDRGQHAEVVDEGSSNGTYVNGVRVSRATLADGDLLRVGDCFLLFRALEADAPEAPAIESILGRSPALVSALRLVERVAPTELSVLLLGPSGAGKGVAARAVHDLSGRRGALVSLNCSAIPEQLAESQLFGHTKGAFTGAASENLGAFRAADGGTLFLDEVGELPLTIQPKLLRALDERAVAPVGGTREYHVDVRVIAATDIDIEAAVAAKQFRGDLWARLHDFAIELPPLVERREDILLLLLSALPKPPPKLRASLVEALLSYHWPFNVREVLKVGRELSVRAEPGKALTVDMVASRLGTALRDAAEQGGEPEQVPDATVVETARAVASSARPRPNRDELEALLRESKGVVSEVARLTGRSRRQVRRWLALFELDAERYRE